jgi:hypothetical protein
MDEAVAHHRHRLKLKREAGRQHILLTEDAKDVGIGRRLLEALRGDHVPGFRSS